MRGKLIRRFLVGIALAILLFVVLMITPRAMGALWPERPPIGYHFLWSSYLAVAVGLEDIIDTNPAIPDSVRAIPDIPYKTIGDDTLQLDIYRSANASPRAPLLVFLHGGSWRWGHRHDMLPLLVDFARLGYVTATVSYRLDGYPDCVEDVVDAVDWLYARGDVYGYDAERMALVGASAGAHLAMLAAYGWTPSPADPDSTASNPRVKAVVNIFGPVDLTTDFARDRSTVAGFLGSTYEEAPDRYAFASPLFHAGPDAPPTMTIHGTSDELVPVSQADQLKHKLDSLGVPCVDYRFPRWPHAMILVQRVYDYCLPRMDAFLREHLERQASFANNVGVPVTNPYLIP